MRTPRYIQGKTGVIAAVHGAFRNPESLAYGGDGLPRQYLYLVRFDNTQVWPTYSAATHDKLLIDIYEHWLEPA
jgi:nitrile hydratase